MDERKIPKQILIAILILILIFIIQLVIFINKIQLRKIILLGILIYIVSFSIKNKSLKKQEINNKLKINEKGFKSRIILTKEIP